MAIRGFTLEGGRMTEARWPLQVFFDGACPICSREVRFARKRDKLGRIQWVDIAATGFDAAALGLDPLRIHQQVFPAVPVAVQCQPTKQGACRRREALPVQPARRRGPT